jgi:3-phenylpropionate/cinnamic acid dioxygenase small subunit
MDAPDRTTRGSDADVLQQLIDRQDITDVLYRYASSIDCKDFVTLRTLLADDARASYTTVATLEGGDAIVAWIDAMTADKSWQHHLLSVYHVDFTGPDEARTLTYHTSHQTTVGQEGVVTLIVARYHDTLRRIDGSWKIVEKIMEPGWAEERRTEALAH